MSKSTSPKHLQQKQTQHSTSPHISTTSKKHSVFTADNLKSTHFALSKIIHHGFSYRPTCMCYDSKSSLIAIGTEFGYIRIFGREYIDKCFRDDISSAVLFVSLKTIVEGEKETLRLITISYPSQISLWVIDDFKLQRICCRTFAKEKYSCGHFSQSGKLLFFGCETGNVYILDSSTLALSKQIIHWNRAVGPSVHIHPGPVVVLSSCPNDKQKLFIGYSPCGSSDAKSQDNKSKAGILVKWNLKHLKFEEIAIMHSGLTCISWHPEGKYMLCGHADGSYSAWNLKSLDKPIKIERPHCLISNSTDAEYHPLSHILQISSKIGDVSTCFSGGIHLDSCLRSKYVTIVRKRSTNVLQMDSAIVDMQLIHDSNVEPVAIAILLEEDLMFVDLKSEELLFHKSPHSTIFGKNSPITFIDYIASPPNKFYYNLLKLHNCFNEKITRDVDRRQSITYTNVPFPLTGGVPGETIFSYNEIIITGHMDGKVCFWDSSAMNLSPIYTISTERFIYSKTEGSPTDTTLCSSSNINTDDTLSSVGNDSTASQMLSVKSATLSSYNDNDCLIVVGNFGHVTLMKFNMDHTDSTDELTDISVLEIPALVSPTPEQSPDKFKSVSKQLNCNIIHNPTWKMSSLANALLMGSNRSVGSVGVLKLIGCV
ncbi:hypothetical protein GJ496_008919 [Pomphorhynchus laevis]|nr:hypothetical protein GJ496_008919 [Pomphorhynchus laevis]